MGAIVMEDDVVLDVGRDVPADVVARFKDEDFFALVGQ